MTDRILLSQDRLLITKPGIDASGSPADPDKVFDSDWAFGGALIASGFQEFPYDSSTNGDGGFLAIDFPAQSYVPKVVLFHAVPPTGYFSSSSSQEGKLWLRSFSTKYVSNSDPNNYAFDYPKVTSSQILVPHFRKFGSGQSWFILSGNSWYRHVSGTNGQLYRGFCYIVFAG
ncbi:hypothetical protein NKH72_22240 [Mesorhizobium sp. M0955]|uniref:hypothetical protein n=1 Tax=Mesorhizobium sp. M0955 TaxID=2957033 RepID=UPI00333CDB7A